MENIREYVVLTKSNAEQFQTLIKAYLEKEYTPFGGIATAVIKDEIHYTQVMVK